MAFSFDLGDFGTQVGRNPGFFDHLLRTGGRTSADTVPLGAGQGQPGPAGGLEALFRLATGGSGGGQGEAPGAPAVNMNVVMPPPPPPKAPPSLTPMGTPATPGVQQQSTLPVAQAGASGNVRPQQAAVPTTMGQPSAKTSQPALSALRQVSRGRQAGTGGALY